MKWLFILCVVVSIAATVEDLWRRRVSNYITAGAFLAGLVTHSLLFGLAGTWDSFLGAFFGFIVFLIFFLLGGMGGGDIKLMAGFGAIVGSERIWLAAVLTGMVGGVIALLYLIIKHVSRLIRKSRQGVDEAPARKGMIPYAPAISLGMLLTFLSEDGIWTNV